MPPKKKQTKAVAKNVAAKKASEKKELKAATPPVVGRPRPLSPHLQVYRPQITSVMSITHRATGIANFIGLLLVICWFSALASGPERYAELMDFMRSLLGQIVLLGFTYSLTYHFCNGIRHLAWDMGFGFDLKNVTRSGVAVLIASAGLTILMWWWGLSSCGN